MIKAVLVFAALAITSVSALAVSKGNMAAYCRGEAAGQYGTKPTYVKTKAPKTVSGGYSIDGTVDLGEGGIQKFRCQFDKGRILKGVVSLPK